MPPSFCAIGSNLLGSDLRITNLRRQHSSKIMEADPLTGEPVEVLWVKGFGRRPGFDQAHGLCHVYMEKLLALERKYQGVDTEDEIAAMYPLCAFKNNPCRVHLTRRCTDFCRFRMWIICTRLGDCTGGERQRQSKNGRVQSRVWPPAGVGAFGSGRALSWP